MKEYILTEDLIVKNDTKILAPMNIQVFGGGMVKMISKKSGISNFNFSGDFARYIIEALEKRENEKRSL